MLLLLTGTDNDQYMIIMFPTARLSPIEFDP